jgi:hypothetical protein
MRYMMIYTGPESDQMPSEAEQAAMGAFIHELATAGQLIVTDGLQHSSKGVRVRQSKGNVTVVDGPFSESKEVVGGFAIVEVSSRDEAIDLARRFMAVAGDGQSEIREMYETPAFGEYRRGTVEPSSPDR